MTEQASKVSGIVQIDGTPAQRTVRAFGYSQESHTIDGETVTLSKSLGHATSDPDSGEYTIDLLAGYDKRVFVVAFDDYGADFTPDLAVAVGDRVHPTTPNGHVFECTGAGTLPSEEPTWIVDTETAQLYGTASMIAKPFYRPMVHGPVAPEVISTVTPWTPEQLFNGGQVGVWFDATDQSTLFKDVAGTIPVENDGDLVAHIKDKSGNNNHATQATESYRPAYKTDGFTSWLYFDGINDRMEFPEIAFSSAFVGISAAKMIDGSVQQVLVGNTNSGEKLAYVSTALDVFFRAVDGGGSAKGDTPDHLDELALWTPSRTGADDLSIRFRGADLNTTAGQSGISEFNLLGASYDANQLDIRYFLKGDFYNLVLAEGYDLASAQRLEGHAAHGLGIAASLPENHPYRFEAPVIGAQPEWTPANLFSNNEAGAWYDPSDLTTLFQDEAATIPVENDGDPVGAMLDKSGNGITVFETGGQRPTYRTDGQRHWLYFGGNQKLSGQPISTLSSNFQLIGAARASNADSFNALLSTKPNGSSSGNLRMTVFVDSRSPGSPSRIAFIDRDLQLEQDFYLNNPIGYGTNPAVISLNRLGDQAQGWVNATPSSNGPLTVGNVLEVDSTEIGYQEAGDFYMTGNFYGLIVTEDMNESARIEAEKYLAEKSGVTLS